MAGQVMIGTQVAAKPSQLVQPETEIAVKAAQKYVGRGGLKLEGALDHFKIDVVQ